MGRRCLIIEADLATVEGPTNAARAALEAWGAIDILVNNAGVTAIESILEAKVESWDWIMAVNLRAPFLLAQALAPRMIEKRAGKIVNVSSQTSEVALHNHAAYMASKAGLNALTKTMTVEWAQYNIQSNAVCPTVIMTPMGEMVWGDPQDRRSDARQDPARPLRQGGGDRRPRAVPRFAGLGPHHRPVDLRRRRLHCCLEPAVRGQSSDCAPAARRVPVPGS